MEKFRLIVGDIFRLEVPFGKGWTGITLINGAENKILIDSGASEEHVLNCLIPALREMKLELDDIDYLCCTHCHGDHIGGHKSICEISNIKVVCYDKSVDKLVDPKKYSIKIRSIFPEYSPAPPPVLDGVNADIVLMDYEVLADRLEIIPTPGHDSDCICFFDHKTSTLITGDSLQGNGTISQGIALCMYYSDYINSLTRLNRIRVNNIVAGHDYLISGDCAIGEKQVEIYLTKCMQLAETYKEYVLNKIGEKDNDLASIAKGLIEYMGNREPEYLFLPLYTVKSIVEEWKCKI